MEKGRKSKLSGEGAARALEASPPHLVDTVHLAEDGVHSRGRGPPLGQVATRGPRIARFGFFSRRAAADIGRHQDGNVAAGIGRGQRDVRLLEATGLRLARQWSQPHFWLRGQPSVSLGPCERSRARGAARPASIACCTAAVQLGIDPNRKAPLVDDGICYCCDGTDKPVGVCDCALRGLPQHAYACVLRRGERVWAKSPKEGGAGRQSFLQMERGVKAFERR